MVFPAPVSPVTTVSPGPNSITASSITPRPRRCISNSTGVSLVSPGAGWVHTYDVGVVRGPDRAPSPAVHREPELGHQAIGERRPGQPGQPDRHRRAAHLDPGPGRQVHAAPAVAPEHGAA